MRLRAFAGGLRRAVADENLDLYALCVAAVVFTILGVAGIADARLLSSVILAFLAVLAWSQVRTRNHLARAATSSSGSVELLETWPPVLEDRRLEARDWLFVGISMSRTLYTSRDGIRRSLERGSRIRVLLLDPSVDALMRHASLGYPSDEAPEQVRLRIENSLKELEYLRVTTGGNLQLRVSTIAHHAGFNVIDATTSRGLVVVQNNEHRPVGEAGPILRLETRDGHWFHRLAAEAERLWDDGTPWPPPATVRAAGVPAASFGEEFDAGLVRRVLAVNRVFVTGTARNALLVEHVKEFEALLRRGGVLRLLLLDPAADEALEVAAERGYAQRSPAFLRERILQSLALLAELAARTSGDLEVRLTRHPFAMGMLGLECDPEAPAGDEAAVFLEYYTFQAPGEPKFVADASSSRWRGLFLGEAQALWRAAAPCDLATYRKEPT